MAPRIRAIGIDFDGTLSDGGRPADDTLESLREARDAGLRLVLVTGRILFELESVFPDCASFFDVVVAENGALLARASGLRALATPVPFVLDDALLRRGVVFRRGEVLLASVARYAPVVLEELSRLGLECQIVRNRGEIMVVPSGVSKGTGLGAALGELGISPHDTAGIGDAENDHTLLDACELGVAVANAVPALKAHADLVLAAPGERGVVSFLRGPVLRGEQLLPSRRWRVTLGRFADGSAVQVPAAGVNVLFEGETLSGKSHAAGLFAEGLLRLGYSICVLDPEGDHRSLGDLHGCLVVGGHEALPTPERLADLFQSTFGSVVIDLSLLPRRESIQAGSAFLMALQQQRESSGLPHWILVDEAHVQLGDDGPACPQFRPEQKGFCLVTYQPEHLCEAVRQSLDVIVRSEGEGHARITSRDVFRLPFVFDPRLTAHVRHRHKYVHVALPPHRRFHFRTPSGLTGRSAGNLEEFHQELLSCSSSVVRHHVLGHDFSRWVGDVMQDAELASALRAIEDHARADTGAGLSERIRGDILDQVESRYLGSSAPP